MKKLPACIALCAVVAVWVSVGFLLSCGEPTEPSPDRHQATDTDSTTDQPPDSLSALTVPDTLDFADTLDTLRLAVANSQPMSFSWSTYVFHQYITVTDSGRAGDSLTVAIDRFSEGLQTGWNYGYFYLYTDRDSLGPKKVVVRVMKLAAGEPLLSVDAPTYDFGVRLDSIYCSVRNDGGGKLIWRVEAPSWMRAVPDSGEFEGGFWIRALRDSLGRGPHLDTIRVTSNGGDTAIVTSITIAGDTTGSPIADYWPLAPGNSWVWLNPSRTLSWAIEVQDTFSRGGRAVWVLFAETSDGDYGTYYAVVANGKLSITADSTNLTHLSDASYPNCGMVECWSSYHVFGLFEVPIAPGATTDPYWKTRSEYVPGSLEQLMSTHTIWDNPNATISDLAVGSLDTCMGLKEYGAGNELYTILGKGVGPLIWDGFTLAYCRVGGTEHGSVPEITQSRHFAVNRDTTDELLYWFEDDQGNCIHYMGYRHESMPVPTHVVFEDDAGEVAGAVFLRPDFQPVMWILDTLTIGIHNTNPGDNTATDSAYDPTNAYHMVLFNEQQVDFRADIYPHDPYEVLDSLEWMLDMWLTHLRDAFDTYEISSYNDLIACGYIDSPQRERFQVIASFIAMGAALVAYEMDNAGGLAKAAGPEMPGPFIPEPVKEMAKKIAEYLQDELACKYCPKPGVPTVRMLQCQGLKTVLWTGQVCHDSFMSMRSASRCLELCKVSTMCFTNICMPRDVAASDVKNVLFENDLDLTPKDVEDMVRSNINDKIPLLNPF